MSNAINPNNDEHKNDPYLVSALFFIRGKNLNPDEATDLLGILPYLKHKKGDQHGEKGEMVWKSGFWSIDTKSLVPSQDIEQHIVWILDQLEKAKDELEAIRSTDGIYIELEIIISLFRRNYNVTISSKTIQRLSAMNIPLGFSISYMAYPNEEE